MVLLLRQYKVLGEEDGNYCQIKRDSRFARLSWTFFLSHCPAYIVIYLSHDSIHFWFDSILRFV